MMTLVGLRLDAAQAILAEAGIFPEVVFTRAPRASMNSGCARVIFASEDGRQLIVADFPDTVEEVEQAHGD